MPPQQPPVAPSVPAPSPVGKHVLPNGVRLRLALTTVINDFFSRQPPVYRQLRVQAASAVASSSTSRSDPGPSASRRTARSSSSSVPSSSHLSWLPQSLVPLLSVSSAAASVAISSSPHLVRVRFLFPHRFTRCPYLRKKTKNANLTLRASHRIRLTRPSNNNHFLWSPGRACATCSQSASIEVPQARPCSFAARATYTAHARSASLRVAPHHRAHVVTIARTSGRPLPRAGASPAFPRALASEAGLRCRD